MVALVVRQTMAFEANQVLLANLEVDWGGHHAKVACVMVVVGIH